MHAFPPDPPSLRGEHVHLVPLALEHAPALAEAVRDGALWQLWYTRIPSPETMQEEIERRLAMQRSGSMLPFTVVDPGNAQPVGMTTYMNLDPTNHRAEIGSTWYAKRVQRTALNTEAKLLLLEHAFRSMDCVAVELRTHFMNQQSRRAIERLGAKLDGILRSHTLMPNGTWRDTCVYSILRTEWPAIEANLRWQLDRSR